MTETGAGTQARSVLKIADLVAGTAAATSCAGCPWKLPRVASPA
jgi:hypothetical protein